MEEFKHLVEQADAFVWGPWLLALLVGTHIAMTFKTGFIQRKLWLSLKLSVAKDDESSGDVSQFGALATALASTLGTGNIIGVGTAIALGGPGAVLWLLITATLGMATKYSESFISVKYRVKTEEGTMLGGAMYALERGLKMKWLGVVFAAFTALACFGTGDGVQSNAMAVLIHDTFGVPKWIVGIAVAGITGVVLIGGIKSITKVCEILVPFMAGLYIIGCAIILALNHAHIIPAVVLICKSAFTPQAATGGFIGSTMLLAARWGITRGLFSNEAGLGTEAIVAAAAKTRNTTRQALVSSTGVFWSTVVCVITGIVIISSVLGNPEVHVDGLDGSKITSMAFSQIPYFGKMLLTFGLITFALSTILGWSYFGEKGMEYLLGPKSIVPYRIVYAIIAFFGAVVQLDIAWCIADTLNGLMAIPNLIAVLLLSNVIAAETKKYISAEHINDIDDLPPPLRTALGKKTGN